MLVVPGMSDSLDSYFNENGAAIACQKCTYVVPAYEIHRSVEYPPEDKQVLLQLIKKRLARRFHVKVR